MKSSKKNTSVWLDWNKIKIKNVEAYSSSAESRETDRAKVILDMPMETYRKFQKQIEAPDTLRNRRIDDPESKQN